MIEPKWERDPFGTEMLAVAYDTFIEFKERGTVREFADHFAMNGREFATIFPPNRYVVLLMPRLLYTYGCQHAVEPGPPICPECGAEVVCWQ